MGIACRWSPAIVVGLVALAAIAAFRGFGQAVMQKVQDQGQQVLTLQGNGGSRAPSGTPPPVTKFEGANDGKILGGSFVNTSGDLHTTHYPNGDVHHTFSFPPGTPPSTTMFAGANNVDISGGNFQSAGANADMFPGASNISIYDGHFSTSNGGSMFQGCTNCFAHGGTFVRGGNYGDLKFGRDVTWVDP